MDMSSIVPLESNPNISTFKPGDTIKATTRLKEAQRQTTHSFQGVVIRIRQGGIRASFTVRRSVYGIGVERTFYYHSPLLEKVEVIQRGRARRARLYYLRDLSAKQIRAKLKSTTRQEPKQEAKQEASPQQPE